MKKMKRIAQLLLMVSLMAFLLVGCKDSKAKDEGITDKEEQTEVVDDSQEKEENQGEAIGGDSETAEPTPEVSEPENPTPEDSETDTTEPAEPVMPMSELAYTLSEEDIAEYESQLLLCQVMIEDGAAYEDLEKELELLDELATDIQYQAITAQVLYYYDLDNAEAEENYLYSSEVSTEITTEFMGFLADIYNSGKYEEYFEDFLEIEIAYLECYTDETTELEIRNAEILTEFLDIQYSDTEGQVAVLYSEFINNSNEIAQKHGFANYYDYATTFNYKRDYSKEEREQYRAYVKEYIIPLYNEAFDWYNDAYYSLSKAERKIADSFIYDEYNTLGKDYLGNYFNSLPVDSKSGMQHMFDNETYYMTDNHSAYTGAFTVDIRTPYCYFSPSYQDAFTVIHELGHYYADLRVDTSWLPFDLLEVHSQGNEMLFLSYLGTELDPEIHEVLEAYKLYAFLANIVQATLMDNFEEVVYSTPLGDGYTAEEFDEIGREVVSSYGIAEDDAYTYMLMQSLWRIVGITSPVYYISYGTSAMAALSLYSQSIEDYEAASEAYRILIEECEEDAGFKSMLEKAGIASPFEEEAYIKLRLVLAGGEQEESMPEITLNLELQETDNPRIMEILNVSDTYMDSVDNTYCFSYQIPQFNVGSESAKSVNQRMVDDILPYVESEFETMALDCSLTHGRIGYEVFEYGDIVSVLVTIPYDNDVRYYYTYSYDFENDKEVTNAELLALHGMTEEGFVEAACKMEEEYWTKMCESVPENSEDREWFQEAIEETKARTTTDLPMYLDADGTLKVFVPFPSMAGASWYYELCDF